MFLINNDHRCSVKFGRWTLYYDHAIFVSIHNEIMQMITLLLAICVGNPVVTWYKRRFEMPWCSCDVTAMLLSYWFGT